MVKYDLFGMIPEEISGEQTLVNCPVHNDLPDLPRSMKIALFIQPTGNLNNNCRSRSFHP